MSNIDNSKFNPMYRAPIMRIIEYRSGNNSSVRRACLQIRNVTERLNRNIKRMPKIESQCKMGKRNGHEQDNAYRKIEMYRSILVVILHSKASEIDFPN